MSGAPERGRTPEARPETLERWEGRAVAELERAWRVPRLEAYGALPSTNDRARELALEGAAPWTTVVADAQTAGRGRGGARWHSPAGLGLWISVLLPPGPDGGGPPLDPLLVGVAAARAVDDEVPGARCGLKWPNDLYLDDRKVGGVLCEGLDGRGAVAGVGVNVHQSRDDFPPELRDRAASLALAAGGGEPSRSRLAGALLDRLRELWRPPPRRLEGALAREVGERDWLRGRTVRTAAGRRGRVRRIAEDGALLLRYPDGEAERLVAGSVEPVEAPAETSVEPEGSGSGGAG